MSIPTLEQLAEKYAEREKYQEYCLARRALQKAEERSRRLSELAMKAAKKEEMKAQLRAFRMRDRIATLKESLEKAKARETRARAKVRFAEKWLEALNPRAAVLTEARNAAEQRVKDLERAHELDRQAAEQALHESHQSFYPGTAA